MKKCYNERVAIENQGGRVMLQKYVEFFLHEYSDSDYLTRVRSRLLLIFESATFFIVLLFTLLMLAADLKTFVRTAGVTGAFSLGLAASLVMLRKGRYLTAANLFILFASLTIGGGFLMHIKVEPQLLYTRIIIFSILSVSAFLQTPLFACMRFFFGS
jgi:Zn-dependent protease